MAFAVYALTAHRVLGWWHSSSYILAADSLGVHLPPGSLILTLLGWPVARITPDASTAFSLHLLDGLLAAATGWLVMKVAFGLTLRHRLVDTSPRTRLDDGLIALAVGCGVLVLLWGETMWRYAIVFEPYVLSALFMALLLGTSVKWWYAAGTGMSNRWLFVVTLLFGLDFSVHRTNMLLLPGFVLWVLLFRRADLRHMKTWVSGGTGFVAGLAFHLLIMALAARGPALNGGDPSNWARFYDYITLQQYGGGFLVNLWPRNASFFAVQLADYLRVFVANFVTYGYVLAGLPMLLATAGVAALWSRDRRLAIGLLIFFLCSGLGTVVFFNLPDNYPLPMDRHYLPSFVAFALFVAVGAGTLISMASTRRGLLRVPVWLLVSLVLLLPVKQLVRNYSVLDGSNRRDAYEYAHDILSGAEPDAILYAAGEVYFPLACLQQTEKIRPDVEVVSMSLTNTHWYARQVFGPGGRMPLRLTGEEVDNLEVVVWQDSTIVTRIEGTADTFGIEVKPTIADQFLLIQDLLLVRLIEVNRWKRPIYFTEPPGWLRRYSRPDGRVWRLVPKIVDDGGDSGETRK